MARIGLNHTLINAGLKTFETLVCGVATAKDIDSLYENIGEKGIEITQQFSNIAKF